MTNEEIKTVLSKIKDNAILSAGWDFVAMTTDAQDVIDGDFDSVDHAMRIYQSVSEVYDDRAADAENTKF